MESKGVRELSKKEYNGWTNYATWRIQLEFFSAWGDHDWKGPEEMKHTVLHAIKCDNPVAESFARIFVDNANFQEIYDAWLAEYVDRVLESEDAEGVL